MTRNWNEHFSVDSWKDQCPEKFGEILVPLLLEFGERRGEQIDSALFRTVANFLADNGT